MKILLLASASLVSLGGCDDLSMDDFARALDESVNSSYSNAYSSNSYGSSGYSSSGYSSPSYTASGYSSGGSNRPARTVRSGSSSRSSSGSSSRSPITLTATYTCSPGYMKADDGDLSHCVPVPRRTWTPPVRSAPVRRAPVVLNECVTSGRGGCVTPR